jgi:uncharacterized protein YprB with RNaseH-like and TPR domain
MGGRVVETGAGSCLLIQREYDAWRYYGKQQVGSWASASRADSLAVLARAWRGGSSWPASLESAPRLMFLDLETTGLTGGAGNHAFLIGCGFFDADDGFVTRQLFLTSFGGERALLTLLSDWLSTVDAIVTYNGRTFDVPVIETRWLFHRMPPSIGDKAHFDMLHPARCLWRDRDAEPPEAGYRLQEAGAAAGEMASCSLGALERWLLGFTRLDDVGGFEIPALYFQYLRTGNAGPLEAVLEHNRLDLLSLAGVTARVADLVSGGASAASGARECVALGRLYDRAGEFDRASACYERASGLEGFSDGSGLSPEEDIEVRAEALRRLALRYRRDRRYVEAAATWRRILELEHRMPLLDWQAMEALAIHHEHRVKDLDGAREFALRALGKEIDADRRRAVHHRLARLSRKLDRRSATFL